MPNRAPKSDRILREIKTLKQPFAQKIKSADEVARLIDPRPRKHKVVMCHGAFDIVHPGHIRQLIYAKTKGDILVVSITADKYVTKRPVSPYVPQELRALNIAAFEIVNYVIVDHNPTPIENIKKIKPDFFVKGFEYSLNGIHPKTQEEVATLSSYGGKMIFSPGDIVYSSSKLLTLKKPNLSHEQLLTIMFAESVSFEDLYKSIKAFKGKKIHVVGDLIVDKISQCTVLGPSKDLSPSVSLHESKFYVGGAGNVARHLRALGAKVVFTTLVGKDKAGRFALRELKRAKLKVNAIYELNRPTTIKERFINEKNQVMLQVNQLDNTSATDDTIKGICKLITKTTAGTVILSDFRHGIFNRETIQEIRKHIPHKALKIADSQVSNRWGNILDFEGFNLITPNEREARFALADQDTTIRSLAQKLYIQAKCKNLILKLGENGIMVQRSPKIEELECFYIDSFADEVVDPVGAGDALLATAALALAASRNIVQASILGNLAAAIECSSLGNNVVSARKLTNKLKQLQRSLQ